MTRRVLSAAVATLIACTTVMPLAAQTASRMDSMQHVGEVVVTSKLVFREVIPSQKLGGKELQRLSTQSVADALRYFSGVQLKDYGGVGGVKTVDVRAMGTNHLAVSYDGMVLGNAQNGQTDLGQLSLDNVEEVTLYNGQKSAIFQPASDFASASSVYIRTRTPRFEVGRNTNFKAKVKYGASDMLRLSSLWEQRLGEDLSMGLNAEVLTASGKYKFRYTRKNMDGTTAWDTTATRQNGDIHAERIEANVHGLMNQGGWQLKGYLYNSSRGIPGAIVNNVWRRGERQQDLNTFVQARIQKSFGEGPGQEDDSGVRFSTQWMAKYAYYNTHYVNRDSTRLPVDNRYKQQEAYLSTANVVELLPGWSASASYDIRWNKLAADTYNFVHPTRWTHMLSAATAIDYRRLKVQASVVGTWVKDHTDRTGHTTIRRLTPAVFANVYPLRQARWLSMRAYVKRSFRMPTFNDLYYTEMGNAALKPETATQFDAGLVLSKHFTQGLFSHVGLQVDAYINKVKDKIIAYPKGQQFRWTMLNLGRVNIKGIDVVAETSCMVAKDATATLRAQYTYQKAIDVTDATKPFYHHQIPYIPRHSGSVIAALDWHNITLNYSFLYTGQRWNEQENIDYNHMQPWYTSDISATYTLPMKRCELRIVAELNNVFNQQYDVIANYPMPGRNAIVGVEIRI